jgi:hypothetical protein
LKEPDNISGEIDPGIFGNILHEILRKLYHDFTGKTLSVETLDRLLKSDELLRASIIDSIREKFRREQDGYVDGNELIIREILYVFVKRILQADLSLAPFTILNLEDTFSFPVVIRSGDKDLQIRIGGIADRVDIVGGTTRIVDYKTGIVSDKISSMEELFTNDRKKDHDGWLQTLIYCEAYLAGGRDIPLRPSIYKVRKIAGRDFFDKLKFQSGRNNELIIDDYRIIRNEFLSGLRNVLTTIFDPGEPFIMTKDNRMSCLNCPYKNLCLR